MLTCSWSCSASRGNSSSERPSPLLRSGIELARDDEALDLAGRPVELFALPAVGDAVLERAPGDTDRLGRDAQAAHVERLHRVPETHRLLAQQVLCREPHLLEGDGDGVRGPQAHLIFGLP